jgi:hypothetical protein
MSNEEYIPKRAMSIQAHPDDQEFSIGGTLAKWAKAGCEVTSVVITSGEPRRDCTSHHAPAGTSPTEAVITDLIPPRPRHSVRTTSQIGFISAARSSRIWLVTAS